MVETRSSPKGFTIVELLIVIVVIAILAAITIVAYNGIQARANNTAVEADASAIIKKMEMAKIELGRYPETVNEMPDGFSFTKSAYDPTQNNIYYCLDKANQLYTFGLRSRTLQGYLINTGVLSKTTGTSGATTCDAIGKTWVNDTTTVVFQGYVGSTQTWSSSWGWTK